MGYDSPRLLTPNEVSTAAQFLADTPFSRIAEGYKPSELVAADVYPNIWTEEWALQYLADVYAALVGFFNAAAADGDSMLIWLT